MEPDIACLHDILDAARLATAYVAGKTLGDFEKDVQCQDAVIRRLEVIGEAARRVSGETRAKHRDLPWSAMIGMRNVMVHDYNDVDLTIVWDTVQRDLPGLIQSIEQILTRGE